VNKKITAKKERKIQPYLWLSTSLIVVVVIIT